MTRNYDPNRNLVLIKQDEAEAEVSISGIVISQKTERPMRGTVKAVGPNVGTFKVGDRVVFAKYTGKEVEPGLIILRKNEILARFTED